MLRAFLLALQAAVLASLPLSGSISAETPGITHRLILHAALPDATEQAIVWDTRYAPGAVNPPHLHTAAVTFRVLSGTGIWQEEGKAPVTLQPGDSLLAPAGTIHTHWNPSPTEPLRFLEFIVAEEGKDRAVRPPP